MVNKRVIYIIGAVLGFIIFLSSMLLLDYSDIFAGVGVIGAMGMGGVVIKLTKKCSYLFLMKHISFISMLLSLFSSFRYFKRNMNFEATGYFIMGVLFGVAIPLWSRKEE